MAVSPQRPRDAARLCYDAGNRPTSSQIATHGAVVLSAQVPHARKWRDRQRRATRQRWLLTGGILLLLVLFLARSDRAQMQDLMSILPVRAYAGSHRGLSVYSYC